MRPNVIWTFAPSVGARGLNSYRIVETDVTQHPDFTFLPYGPPDGKPEATFEADALGQRRIGAASVVATKYLAYAASEVFVIFGAGWQAESQIEVVARILPHLRRVLVVDYSPVCRDRFVAKTRRRISLLIKAADSQAAACSRNVLVTATGSSEPVFVEAQLTPGTPINPVGSNFTKNGQLDPEVLHHADKVVVDSAEVARLQCRDLLTNGFAQDELDELCPKAAGRAAVRRGAAEITVFEPPGFTLEDMHYAMQVPR